MNASLRELTPAQRRWLTSMAGLAGFAAGAWFDRIPISDLLLVTILIIGVAIGVWLFRPPTWSPRTPAESVGTVAAGPRELLPNLLTASRPFFGVGVGLALHGNQPLWAYGLYLVGNATDVVDGMMARDLNGRTAWGKDFDAVIDALFNSLTGLGILWVCIRPFPTIDWLRLAPLFLNVVGFAIAQIVWGAHTAPAKLMSGVLRVVLLAVLLSLVPSESLLAAGIVGGLLMAGGFYYEYLVMQTEKHVASSSLPHA